MNLVQHNLDKNIKKLMNNDLAIALQVLSAESYDGDKNADSLKSFNQALTVTLERARQG